MSTSEKPYDQRLFCRFCNLVGEMFLEPNASIIFDLLAREQAALSEADFREVLNYSSSLVRKAMSNLQRQQLVERIRPMERGASKDMESYECESETTAHCKAAGKEDKTDGYVGYWRICPNVISVVEDQYQQFVKELNEEVATTQNLPEFECPHCGMLFTGLDVVGSAEGSTLEDEHPQCGNCNEKLVMSDSEKQLWHAKEQRARALQRMAQLRNSLDCLAGMDIPPGKIRTKVERMRRIRQHSLIQEEIDHLFNSPSPPIPLLEPPTNPSWIDTTLRQSDDTFFADSSEKA